MKSFLKDYILSVRGYKSIKIPVFIGVFLIVLFTLFIVGIFQYRKETRAMMEEYRRLSEVALRPIIELATRGVDGGNLLILRNENAQSIYKASGVRYLKISGLSRGMEKTEFSPPIPPQKIEYEFVKDGSELAWLKEVVSNTEKEGLDREDWLYIVRSPLKGVKNGGEVVAVFPAGRLKGYGLRVVKDIAKVAIVIVLINFFPLYLFLWMVSKTLNTVTTGVHEIGSDLTRRLPDLGRNEIGEIGRAFNQFIEQLHSIVSDTANTVITLTKASEELSSSSVKILKGSEEQSRRASQIATASEEMSATIAEVAKNAHDAAESAREANRVAQKGGEVVEKTITSVNSIASISRDTATTITSLGDRSKEIGEIIKVIEEIADQTNLLALNATIEAARAGEQGRGFAVVADEVRKLAERTTKATKEIGDMIKVIQEDTDKALSAMDMEVKAVEEGVSLAEEAGLSLKEIVKKVEDVSSMIDQIATATEEQSQAAEQISSDIETMAGISKDTTRDVERISEASSNIARLASRLESVVSQFKIEKGISRQVSESIDQRQRPVLEVLQKPKGSRRRVEVIGNGS